MNRNKLTTMILSDKNMNKAFKSLSEQKGIYALSEKELCQVWSAYTENKETIQEQILRCLWFPAPGKPVEIMKKDGTFRKVLLLQPQDRLIQQAVFCGLREWFRNDFSDSLYLYDKYRGVRRAHRKCLQILRSGHPYALKLDVKNCGESLSKNIAMKKLSQKIFDKPAIELLSSLIYLTQDGPASLFYETDGLFASSELTGLIIDICLMELDEWLDQNHIPFVRFTDDWMIFGDDPHEITEYLAFIEEWLQTNLGLQLNKEKTAIQHGSYGPFLGARILHSKKKDRYFLCPVKGGAWQPYGHLILKEPYKKKESRQKRDDRKSEASKHASSKKHKRKKRKMKSSSVTKTKDSCKDNIRQRS